MEQNPKKITRQKYSSKNRKEKRERSPRDLSKWAWVNTKEGIKDKRGGEKDSEVKGLQIK